ncbi:hypothetical protein DH2020_039779 [Rehmannia glutinosa]|uniref:Endonuclease/exonuclease/phosphatase domain-containing protein n=1 Tax=Rehmannia glutinosa TaxID=99300 RepID=A0ABR0UUV8_REHGL
MSILWRKPYDISLSSYSNHHIAVKVNVEDGRAWQLGCIYGWLDHQMRKNTWQLLRNLNPGQDTPWICMGDFNEIMWLHEKMGGNIKAFADMEAFRNAAYDCTLTDLGYTGNIFTWTNGQALDQNIQERLDRALATETWRDIFPKCEVEHLPRHHSDHAPLIVHIDGADKRFTQNKKRRRKLFRFESYWLERDGCTEAVKTAWRTATTCQNFEEKIKSCSISLQQWDKLHGGQPQAKITKLREKLEKIQNGPQTEIRINEGKQIEVELDELYRLEEIFWHQRSRALWIKAGDRNTRFFHRKASNRNARNNIEKIKNDDGMWIEDEKEVAKILRGFSKCMYKSTECIETHAVWIPLRKSLATNEPNTLWNHIRYGERRMEEIMEPSDFTKDQTLLLEGMPKCTTNKRKIA